MRWKTLGSISAIVSALALAGCGAGNGTAAPAAANRSTTTVSARNVTGVGTILVTSAGVTLYFAYQESSGSIHCVDACLRIWTPLTVASGHAATAGTGVGGTLTTVTRPDGPAQVTYDGKPLYTFTQDGGPGHANGNGVTDSFNNTQFLWHAATASGSAAPTTAGTDGYGY
jgi:predicted lipoprotein with Yx(FWY)xxD motif